MTTSNIAFFKIADVIPVLVALHPEKSIKFFALCGARRLHGGLRSLADPFKSLAE